MFGDLSLFMVVASSVLPGVCVQAFFVPWRLGGHTLSTTKAAGGGEPAPAARSGRPRRPRESRIGEPHRRAQNTAKWSVWSQRGKLAPVQAAAC